MDSLEWAQTGGILVLAAALMVNSRAIRKTNDTIRILIGRLP